MISFFNTLEFKNHQPGFSAKRLYRKIFILAAMGAPCLQAQTSDPSLDGYMNFSAVMFLILLLLTFLGIVFLNDKKEEVRIPHKNKAIALILQKLSGAAPIEKENDILLEHDFDGIKELDNNLPPWWKFLFYATIVFAAAYLLNFHVFSKNKTMADEYKEEVQIADAQKAELIRTGAFISETSVTLLKDVESLSKGKEIFSANCSPCHGGKGEGIVGPNLTDDYWLHGGGIKNIFTTIKYGVVAKGMLSWQTQLSPKQMQQAASYVISLHGTNPPNGKPPEGTEYKETADSSNVDITKM